MRIEVSMLKGKRWVALAVWGCSILAGCKIPAYVGVIRFEPKGGSCQARATSLEVNLKVKPDVVPTAYWLVYNECGEAQKQVRVGNFVSGGNQYDVVDCKSATVDVAGQGVGLLDCPVKLHCARNYKYSVYVGSTLVVDPELRVKGNRLHDHCALPPFPTAKPQGPGR